MNYIGFTHFNNSTYEENLRYRNNKNIKCIYCCPILINENIPYDSNIYVIEMNNEMNKLMGIGKINNHPIFKDNHKVYNDQNFNRYVYIGKKYISRESLKETINGNEIITYFDNKLFKGKTHRKRGHGIRIINQKFCIDKNKNYITLILDLFKINK